MANWYGASRSNYFTPTDKALLVESIKDFDIEVADGKNGKVALLATSEDGDWPSYFLDEDGDQQEFSFEDYVCPFLAEGEVMVLMTAGAEKLRYITGYAESYTKDGKVAGISINDIYKLTAEKLGIEQEKITHCQY